MKSMKREATLAIGLFALFFGAAGCRSAPPMTIVCGPRINSFGAPPESKGRALEIALISLSEDNIRKLARADLLGKVSLDDDEDQVFQNITADAWFKKGVGERVQRVLQNEGDLALVTVRPEEKKEVPINKSGMWSKRAGILALANFSGIEDEKNRQQFQTSAWAPSRGRVLRTPQLKVEETTIMWAE